MKLGGLFSGIGGFELAWTRLGGEVAWMCEWDKNARKVLEARFPGVPIYPDVRELDPAEVEAVDVLTGGSPCQGFSVAGTRSGLEHGESRLFADYIRIMDGLAERGLKWALWENVPGVLSIEDDDGNRTFEHVVAALAGGTQPVRLDRAKRWNTGLAAGRGRAVAWRVLDSRFFGVAQRRRRVFACVAFGDSAADRAGRALLAVAEGVRGDSASGVEAGEGAAGGVAGGVGGSGIPDAVGSLTTQMQGMSGWAPYNETAHLVPDRAGGSGGVHPPLKARDYKGLNHESVRDGAAVIDSPQGFRMTAIGEYADDDTASTLKQRDHKDATDLVVPQALATGNGQTLFQPQAFAEMNFTTDDETHHVLRAGTKQSTGVLEPYGFSAGNSQHARSMGEEQGVAPPIRAGASGTNQSPTVGPTQYGVRRLTPVECERLQAFPDGWTEPAGSDSARYKALGNAVTVNTVGWILRRMKAQG